MLDDRLVAAGGARTVEPEVEVFTTENPRFPKRPNCGLEEVIIFLSNTVTGIHFLSHSANLAEFME